MYQGNMIAEDQSVVPNPTLELLNNANGSVPSDQETDNPTLKILNEAVINGGTYVPQINEEEIHEQPTTNYYISEPLDEIAEGLSHVGMAIEQSFVGDMTKNPTVDLLATAKNPDFVGQKETHYSGAAPIFNIGLNGAVEKEENHIDLSSSQEVLISSSSSAPEIFNGVNGHSEAPVQVSPAMLFSEQTELVNEENRFVK